MEELDERLGVTGFLDAKASVLFMHTASYEALHPRRLVTSACLPYYSCSKLQDRKCM